jgi:hypothetical protein
MVIGPRILLFFLLEKGLIRLEPGTNSHAWSTSYTGGRYQTDPGSRPALVNSLRDPTYLEDAQHKMAGGMTQVVVHLPSKHKACVQTPVPLKKKKKRLENTRKSKNKKEGVGSENGKVDTGAWAGRSVPETPVI